METRDAFAFRPFDMIPDAAFDPMGQPMPPARLAAMQRLDAGGRARIAGLQGQLWGENARSPARVEYLAAPRLIALAERAWAPDPAWASATAMQDDWNEFANRLGQRELARLDRPPLAYGYRLPPPGAVCVDGCAHLNVALPGLALHYTVDGSEPMRTSLRYRAPVALPQGALFKAATFDTRGRKSRTVTLDPERHGQGEP